MNHLNDHRRCPHCHKDINERGYLMARSATKNVLSARAIAWIIVGVLVIGLLAQLHP